MELRRFSLGTHIMAAPIAFVIYFIGVGLAWANMPDWSPLTHTLSNLGEWYRSDISPWFFNGGCVIAGLLIVFGGLGKFLYEERLNKASGAFFMLGGISLICVGLISGDYEIAHDASAIILFFNIGMALLLTTISDIKEGNKLVLYSSICLLLFCLIQWPFLHEGLSELMPITATMIWTFIQVIKYRQKGIM